jgi:hypothetical protein
MSETDGRKRDISRCCRCGVLKTPENTGKCKRAKNGFQAMCRKCSAEYRRNYRGGERSRLIHNPRGIDSMNQVGSVLREMSELQHQISIENSLCEKRKKMIENYSKEITEPLTAHQLNLREMLTVFIKKTWPGMKQKAEHFRFGSIRLQKRKLIIDLRPGLAGRLRGKP